MGGGSATGRPARIVRDEVRSSTQHFCRDIHCWTKAQQPLLWALTVFGKWPSGNRARFLGGKWEPGQAGRVKGSRNKLGEAFIEDLYAAWEKHGMTAIEATIKNQPAQFLKVIARVLPRI